MLVSDDLDCQLAEWQHYFNWDRPHSAHHGKKHGVILRAEQTPYSEEVQELY